MTPAPEAKVPFDINRALADVAMAVRPYPPAALFTLYQEGHTTVFQQLVACMLSIRTRDETMLPLARTVLKMAPTPADMLRITVEHLDQIIHTSAFHRSKAEQILEISRRTVADFHGVLPCDAKALLSLPGVGPKCVNLVLGIACGIPGIGVDIHVHRITNRWGYVETRTPDATMAALEQRLPSQYWVEINELLVPFGKHVCTGYLPKCSTCSILPMCRQVGVTRSR